ncbi:3-oxoadipate enol-lactonase [Rhizobium sp. AG855]|uniref:3-oxoadipate enol-lactonase n=1 Tax=Rhizobium sp. AG855 TaxID=2183898 RepID=UPI000E746BD9|nr:3-oxoadipate enol-lactonase [Rhizobium sp. AG855]RKE79321.1 3-oxoadipate enol-lactonase [Rhizobium sp. AG855]
MPYLILPSHRLHYQVENTATDRPWLVFCNSLGTDLSMWEPQVASLARHFRILRYDRRGHGLSTAPSTGCTLDELGNDLLQLLDALGIERTHFCGLSIGGLIGQWLGINAAKRIDKIVVAATAPKIGTAEAWSGRVDLVRSQGLKALLPGTRERWFSPEFAATAPVTVNHFLKVFEATSVDAYVGCCIALSNADLGDQIGQIPNQLLAIAGTSDSVCPPEDVNQLSLKVPAGQYCSLPGRHLVSTESAQAFNKLLVDFFGTNFT